MSGDQCQKNSSTCTATTQLIDCCTAHTSPDSFHPPATSPLTFHIIPGLLWSSRQEPYVWHMGHGEMAWPECLSVRIQQLIIISCLAQEGLTGGVLVWENAGRGAHRS